MREKVRKPSAKTPIFVLLPLLALFQLSFALAYGAPQEPQRQALGSLTTVGEVHVNDAVALPPRQFLPATSCATPERAPQRLPGADRL